MAKLYNLAGMTTATTGTGTITLGSAMSGHLTFAQAGVQDGETVTYAIKDGAASEIGRGVYTSSGTTLTRAVLKSTSSNSPINLSGTAEVIITAAAEDFELSNGVVGSSILSDTDVTDNLGSLAVRWDTLFAQRVGTGDTSGDTLKISAYDSDGSAFTDFITLTAGNTPTANISQATTVDGWDWARMVRGECRLTYVGTTSLRLDRFNGRYLFINGKNETIPSGGVTVSNSGVSYGTLYYVYAYMNSSTMTLELSTTGQATDGTYGHQIKSGDATRTLVGMVYGDTGGVFADTATKRYVLSYFSRRAVVVSVSVTSNINTTSAPWVEISTDSRTQFLSWGEAAFMSTVVIASNTSVNVAVYSSIGLGTTVGTYSGGNVGIYGASPVANYFMNISASGPVTIGAGFNCATLMGGRDSGTGTYYSGYRKYSITIQG